MVVRIFALKRCVISKIINNNNNNNNKINNNNESNNVQKNNHGRNVIFIEVKTFRANVQTCFA